MSTPDNALIDAARGRDEKPEAKQLAMMLRQDKVMFIDSVAAKYEAAANLLERQHARIAELKAQLECKPLDTRAVVSDDELTNAFAGTNFGGADHRNELHVAVLKKASGYYCGHTITTIMRELRLIGADNLPTKKGRKLISLAFHALMVGGP